MIFAELVVLGAVIVLGVVFAAARSLSASKARATPETQPAIDLVPTYSERPLEEIERALEQLISEGRIAVEPATEEDRRRARLPAYAGPVFRSLARRYRLVRLTEVDVEVRLHEGSPASDSIGGWRLTATPEEIDIRLAPYSSEGPAASGDMVFDATWSPRSTHEVAVHSTIAHLLVRAVRGERAGEATGRESA